MTKLKALLRTHTAVIASGAKQSLLEKKIASSPEAPRNDVLLSHAMGLWRISAIILTFIVLLPTLALAHSGMGPEEIGPPIMTSGLIGFASYWIVMLWPSAKKKDDQAFGVSGQDLYAPRTGTRPKKRSVRVKRVPRLRKIVGSVQFDRDQQTRRKASDG
jgi:hypothetical protein